MIFSKREAKLNINIIIIKTLFLFADPLRFICFYLKAKILPGEIKYEIKKGKAKPNTNYFGSECVRRGLCFLVNELLSVSVLH